MKHLVTGMTGLLKKAVRFVSLQKLIRAFFLLFFINSLFPAYPASANPEQKPEEDLNSNQVENDTISTQRHFRIACTTNLLK